MPRSVSPEYAEGLVCPRPARTAYGRPVESAGPCHAPLRWIGHWNSAHTEYVRTPYTRTVRAVPGEEPPRGARVSRRTVARRGHEMATETVWELDVALCCDRCGCDLCEAQAHHAPPDPSRTPAGYWV